MSAINGSSAISISYLYSVPNEFSPTECWAFGIMTLCLSVFTVASNGVVIHLMRTSSDLRPLGPLRSLIGSMAWSDLLVGLVLMPLASQYNIRQQWYLGLHGCKV